VKWNKGSWSEIREVKWNNGSGMKWNVMCSERTGSDGKWKLVNYETNYIHYLFDWVVFFYLSVHVFYCVYCFIVFWVPLCSVSVLYVLLLDDICVHGSSWLLVHVVILCVLSSYRYVWCSHVYVLYWMYWCLLSCWATG
jgi:hypothetical protein